MKDKALEARLTAYLRDTEGLFVVEPLAAPDGLDRVHFAAYWWTNYRIGHPDGGPGIRGQHFFATLDSFKVRHQRGEGAVVMLEDMPATPARQLQLPEAA